MSLMLSHRIKKVAFLVLVLIVLFFYYLSNILSHHHSSSVYLINDDHDRCMEREILELDTLSRRYHAAYSHVPSHAGETVYPAYVGNGYLAAALGSGGGLYIRHGRALSLSVPVTPIVHLLRSGLDLKVIQGVLFQSGYAKRLEAIKWDNGCVVVTTQLYAHRSRPSLLIQDILIHNPTGKRLTFSLNQPGISGWHGAQTEMISVKDHEGLPLSYLVTSGIVPVTHNEVIALATATMKVNEVIAIKPSEKKLIHIVTAVQYSEPISNKLSASKLASLKSDVINDITTAASIQASVLMKEHTDIWNMLWRSSFSISPSKAQGALNGDKINATLYYVLSNVHAPQHEINTSTAEKLRIMRSLYFPDRCYEGSPSTLQASTLWSATGDESEISDMVTKWLITLEKHGCASMVNAGAEGVLQAMILSIGALRFRNEHLEFSMHPKDLHRDLHFCRLNYGNNTHVNITVKVGENNKALLYVALDRTDRPYYACDAGCIDPPIMLRKEEQTFPVKLTEPITSLLYITADLEHMKQLKDVIHVKEIVEAPAHEHHVIALHRHGHRWGGLPTIFWVSIALLIFAFHLFLFKIIYNEYCAAQDRYSRAKFSL